MSTGSTQPFRPAGTVSIMAASRAVQIPLAGGGNAVLIYNAAATTAFFRLGGATGPMATLNDTPVPPGGRMLVGGGPFVSSVSVLLSSGSGMVYFTLGDGDTY
jgi:hypothetical protein